MVLTASSYKVLQGGSKAPDFGKLKGIDGKLHSLQEFKGKKALLIVFMCNHCPYVQPKIAKLIELQSLYGKKGLQLVGINCNNIEEYVDDSFEKMKEFVKEKGINFVYLIDESQESAKKFGATCTPDPFLFNEKMELVYHGRIDEAHGKPHETAKTNELEQAIQELLEKGKVSVAPLPSMGCNIKWKPGNEPSYWKH